jgi:hypothetical protein
MSRRPLVGLALATAVSFAVPAFGQQPPAPTAYTFVAQWQIARAQWGTFASDFDKNTRPVLEKLAGDGTLVSWGAFESIVHTPDGYTHGVWWATTSYAAMEKARAELLQSSAASQSLQTATGHRDYLLHSLAAAGKSASGSGYLSVSTYVVKPGKGREWKELWDKYSKPTFDELVAKGTLVGYAVEAEDIHTQPSGVRFVVTLSPGIEAEDQVTAAFDAANEKRTPQERTTIGLMTDALLEPGTHRDSFSRVIRHWRK